MHRQTAGKVPQVLASEISFICFLLLLPAKAKVEGSFIVVTHIHFISSSFFPSFFLSPTNQPANH